MASALARNGGERQELLSAIRSRMTEDKGAVLRPAEVVLILEWVMDCEDAECQAELLQVFRAMGGLDVVRRAIMPDA